MCTIQTEAIRTQCTKQALLKRRKKKKLKKLFSPQNQAVSAPDSALGWPLPLPTTQVIISDPATTMSVERSARGRDGMTSPSVASRSSPHATKVYEAEPWPSISLSEHTGAFTRCCQHSSRWQCRWPRHPYPGCKQKGPSGDQGLCLSASWRKTWMKYSGDSGRPTAPLLCRRKTLQEDCPVFLGL